MRSPEPPRPGLLLFRAPRLADDTDELAGLEVGDRIEAAACDGPCIDRYCWATGPRLIANRVDRGWKLQRLECRGCGVSWRRIWVA